MPFCPNEIRLKTLKSVMLTSLIINTLTESHNVPDGADPSPLFPCSQCGVRAVMRELRHRAAYFWIFLIVMLLRADPSSDEVVANRVGKCEIVVASGRHIAVFHQREVEMSVEIDLEVCNIFNSGQPSHGNLLPLFLVCQRLRHPEKVYLIALSSKDGLCVG